MGLTSRGAGGGASTERRYRDRSKEGLLEQLNESDHGARRWAAHDLAEYPDTAQALCARLSLETDRAVQSAILNSLIKHASVPTVRELIQHLRSDDAGLRSAVTEALGQLPREVSEVIEELLRDEAPEVRIRALGVLATLSHPLVPSWLLRVVREDEHPNVVATALEGLCECGTEEMVFELDQVKLRFREVPFVVFAADVAIARIRRPKS
jgi:HEAT repeat protein